MASETIKSQEFWRNMRWLYSVSRWIIGGAFAIYFIPNLILFGKWTWLSPADYVPVVQQRLVPIVKAIKDYRRDHGELPKQVSDLVPAYLPVTPPNNLVIDIVPDEVEFFDVSRNEDFVRYLFSRPPNGKLDVHLGLNTPYQIPAPTEGWYLETGFVSGQIPLPPVTLDAATRPTTVPTR